jgi:hypothetical protein
VYISWVGPSAPTATVQLAAFAKVLLQPGQRTTVALRLEPRSLAVLHNASTTHSVYLDDAFNETEPVPSHVIVSYHDQNSGLAEICLRAEMPIRIVDNAEQVPPVWVVEQLAIHL